MRKYIMKFIIAVLALGCFNAIAAEESSNVGLFERMMFDIQDNYNEAMDSGALFASREFTVAAGYAGEIVEPVDHNRFYDGHFIARASYWHEPEFGAFVQGGADHDGTRAFDSIKVGAALGKAYTHARPYIGAAVEWKAYDAFRGGDHTEYDLLLGVDFRFTPHAGIKLELEKPFDELEDVLRGFGALVAFEYRF